MSLFTVATVNSPVGYPFKFHIKAIHEKEERQRERSQREVGGESSTNCVDRSELPFGCAANSIGIILLCHCRNIMIFASPIPKEENFVWGRRKD